MRRANRHRWLDLLFLLAATALLSRQLLLPGFIGMANNGDFPKVAGPLCMEGLDREAEKFRYFQPDYLRGPGFCYNPHIPTSEIVPAWIASSLERCVGNRARFDIRWLGALHAAVFLAIYYVLLLVLRRLPLGARVVLALAALWIFADVAFVAYLNSFYSDVPAMLGGMGAIFMAILLLQSEKVEPAMLGVFGLAALFFVTSKAQHGSLGFIPFAAAIWFGWRSHTPRARLAACLAALAIAAGMLWVIARTPGWYTAQSRFNLFFLKLVTPQTSAPDLRELGLDEGDARFAGMHAFMPGNPLDNTAFRQRFWARTSYWRVAWFYMRRPARVIEILRSDLRTQAPLRHIYSNFPKSDRYPPGAQSSRFSSWSVLRTRLFAIWPEHMALWYALVFLCAPWLARYEASRQEKALLWTVWAVALAGAGEFGIASLADAAETARHLWMFHVFTDATIYLSLLFAAVKIKKPPAANAAGGLATT